jgi:antiviral defense system Shedu protein SduA
MSEPNMCRLNGATDMRKVQTSIRGTEYLRVPLRTGRRRTTTAIFHVIEHNSGELNVSLKIQRHGTKSAPEVTFEGQNVVELSLNKEELSELVKAIDENYEPLQKGIKQYLPVGEGEEAERIEMLRELLSMPDKAKTMDILFNNNVMSEDIIEGLESLKRRRAIDEYREMLDQDHVESVWQSWFQKNDWVLGSEFVEVIDSRAIDRNNIADFLGRAYDGFLDVVEIKRPGGNLGFWAHSRDHNNLIQSADLTKAITQANNYLFALETEINSNKFRDYVENTKIAKPRCTLIFGRSKDWGDQEWQAFRILNASMQSLAVLTYDQVLERAERMHGGFHLADENSVKPNESYDDEIPF